MTDFRFRWPETAIAVALASAIAGVLLLPDLATAGPLYGTVRVAGAAAEGAQVQIACPSFAALGAHLPQGDVRTDGRGSYAARVAATGRCEMRVRRGAQAGAPFEVFVAVNPVKIDVELNVALTRVR